MSGVAGKSLGCAYEKHMWVLESSEHAKFGVKGFCYYLVLVFSLFKQRKASGKKIYEIQFINIVSTLFVLKNHIAIPCIQFILFSTVDHFFWETIQI